LVSNAKTNIVFVNKLLQNEQQSQVTKEYCGTMGAITRGQVIMGVQKKGGKNTPNRNLAEGEKKFQGN
jgi:hypothetical protein